MRDIDGTAVHISCSDAIGRLTIINENRRNALDQAAWRAIPKAVEALVTDGARVLIVSGKGAHFCAGADISEFDTVRANAKAARIYEDDNVAAFDAIYRASVPTIAEIRGTCFGGGLGLAAACDLRIASKEATFAVPAAKLGLAYPADSMAMLADAIGAQLVRKMLFAATIENTETMRTSGFLLSVSEKFALSDEVSALASRIAQGAPMSHAANKLSLLSTSSDDIAAARSAGDRTFESLDYIEGRAAFAERRKPQFKGS
ncbi:MAG: enoyl-CoA hydratase-related protein [Pseudomonadota bacterium]